MKGEYLGSSGRAHRNRTNLRQRNLRRLPSPQSCHRKQEHQIAHFDTSYVEVLVAPLLSHCYLFSQTVVA